MALFVRDPKLFRYNVNRVCDCFHTVATHLKTVKNVTVAKLRLVFTRYGHSFKTIKKFSGNSINFLQFGLNEPFSCEREAYPSHLNRFQDMLPSCEGNVKPDSQFDLLRYSKKEFESNDNFDEC